MKFVSLLLSLLRMGTLYCPPMPFTLLRACAVQRDHIISIVPDVTTM